MSLLSTFTSASVRGWQYLIQNLQFQLYALIQRTNTAYNTFGERIALSDSGDVAIISDSNYGYPSQVGRVYVYNKSYLTYSETTYFEGTTTAIMQGVISVSGDGNYFVQPIYGPSSVSINVYHNSGSGFVLETNIPQDFNATQGGIKLNYDGSILLVGAYPGFVYIYSRSGTSWTLQQTLTKTPPYDAFGSRVDIDSTSTKIIVGDNAYDSSKGAAYIYTFSGTWTLQQTVYSDATGTDLAGFGDSVTFNNDGSKVAIGAPNQDSVYVFSYSGGTWTQETKIVSPVTNPPYTNPMFGQQIAWGSSFLVIGAPNYLVPPQYFRTAEGAIFVYLNEDTSWSLFDSFYYPTSPTGTTNLGRAVAINSSGQIILGGSQPAYAATNATVYEYVR